MSTKDLLDSEYKYGFYSDIETEDFPKGINEDIVRLISKKNNEPEWLLDYRLKAFKYWLTLEEPKWAHLHFPKIDFQDIYYHSSPKPKQKLESMDDIDPELLATFEKLGIPLTEQKRISGVAVDAVFDSVSVGTTHQKELEELGVIFCSISEAVEKHGQLSLKDALKVGAYAAFKGFPVTKAYAGKLQSAKRQMSQFPAAVEIFFRQSAGDNASRPYQLGETLFQKDLAETYKSIANQGADWFYQGEFARVLLSQRDCSGERQYVLLRLPVSGSTATIQPAFASPGFNEAVFDRGLLR